MLFGDYDFFEYFDVFEDVTQLDRSELEALAVRLATERSTATGLSADEAARLDDVFNIVVDEMLSR